MNSKVLCCLLAVVLLASQCVPAAAGEAAQGPRGMPQVTAATLPTHLPSILSPGGDRVQVHQS